MRGPLDRLGARLLGGPRSRGFTLLEVLVALTVAGFSLVALLSMDGANHDRALRAQRTLGAVQLAREKLADATVAGVAREGEESGEEGLYRWTRSVGAGPVPGLAQIVITLSWGEGAGQGSYRVAAFLPE